MFTKDDWVWCIIASNLRYDWRLRIITDLIHSPWHSYHNSMTAPVVRLPKNYLENHPTNYFEGVFYCNLKGEKNTGIHNTQRMDEFSIMWYLFEDIFVYCVNKITSNFVNKNKPFIVSFSSFCFIFKVCCAAWCKRWLELTCRPWTRPCRLALKIFNPISFFWDPSGRAECARTLRWAWTSESFFNIIFWQGVLQKSDSTGVLWIFTLKKFQKCMCLNISRGCRLLQSAARVPHTLGHIPHRRGP